MKQEKKMESEGVHEEKQEESTCIFFLYLENSD